MNSGVSNGVIGPRQAAECQSVGQQEAAIHPEDALIALGEVAAAFAGFSGVVAALGYRSVTEWPAAARFRFENLLVVSVAAALFAFLPITIQQFSASPMLTWSLSSAALGFFALLLLVIRPGSARRIHAAHPDSLRRWMAWMYVLLLVSVGITQAGNIVGWPMDRGGASYVLGILGLLVLSGLQFILLALDSAPGGRRDTAAKQGHEADVE